jgi:hypothetical protein
MHDAGRRSVRTRSAFAFAFALAFAVPFAACSKKDASEPAPAASSSIAAVDAPVDASSSDASVARRKLEPLPPAPNTDFRLDKAPAPQRKLGSVLADRKGDAVVEVLGVDAPEHVAVGEPFLVRTYFRVLGKPAADYEIGLHIDSRPAKSRLNVDHAPMAGIFGKPSPYPTTRWKVGELLVDAVMARLDNAGTYEIILFLGAGADVLKVKSGPSNSENLGDEFVVAGKLEAP